MHDWIGHAFRLVGVAVASVWQYAVLKRGAQAQRRAKMRVKQLEAAIAIQARLTTLVTIAQSMLAAHNSQNAETQAALRSRAIAVHNETASINRTAAHDLPREVYGAVAHFLVTYEQLLTPDPAPSLDTLIPTLQNAYQLVGEQLRLRLGVEMPDVAPMAALAKVRQPEHEL